MSSSAQARFDETLSRADDILRQRLSREAAELERQDAEQMMAARARQRENAEARRMISERYDPAYQSFGTEVPAATDDEPVARYRARLFNRLVRRLPPTSEWSHSRADDIPAGPAMDAIERLVLKAAQQEGLAPSHDNLPESGEISRVRIDPQTNERSINFYGRESFIKDLSRGGHRVVRFLNPKDGTVLFGPPFPKAP
jgi:hypothetical protein